GLYCQARSPPVGRADPMFSVPFPKIAALVVLVCLVAPSLVIAAPNDDMESGGGPPSTFLSWDSLFGGRPSKPSKAARSSSAKPERMRNKGPYNPEEMDRRIEARIKTLREKLGITPEQEDDWNNVVQAMRDNEAIMGSLVQARHEKGRIMNAVEDMESYQRLAEEHASGLAILTNAFRTLYEAMSPEQKQNADKVFGNFEGYTGRHARDAR
ncbi:MAG: Spy/CpxP family protein refolding chaperone, partial [Alphaproteobacteria bacterium]|nr:Spy/CpxP family protein refolding chaperone [Alphaproteobacteria bacterium]